MLIIRCQLKNLEKLIIRDDQKQKMNQSTNSIILKKSESIVTNLGTNQPKKLRKNHENK